MRLAVDLQLEDRKFDKVLPGLSASLKERCPNLEYFVIKTGRVHLDMFANGEDLGKHAGIGTHKPVISQGKHRN